ncbi:unnamed protein product, partial [Vitis vinifera]
MGYDSNACNSFGCGDWEQRRSWIAIVKLDYCELSAIGIWESTFNER